MTTDPLFMKQGINYYFYQNDHQGTQQKLIGTNGLVVWAGVYDSFGNCQGLPALRIISDSQANTSALRLDCTTTG